MTELVTLKFRRGTTAEWEATTSKLAAGEPGFDITTGYLKIGDGSSAWANLEPFKPGDEEVGSSITANGASVVCDDPASSGSILLKTTANTVDSLGNIVLDSSAAAYGYVYINSHEDVDITAGSGVSITTSKTKSFFDNTTEGGPGAQISFSSTDSTNPALLTIGGPLATTGLYVSNTQLLFNNVAVGEKGPTGNDGLRGPTGNDGPRGPTGNDGLRGPTGNDGLDGLTLNGIDVESILLSDGLGGVIASNNFTFNTTSGISINAQVDTNRLVMSGYGGAYYSDDYGDSWNICTNTIPVYGAVCSDSGIWIGADGSRVVTSDDGIFWVSATSLAGQPGNDNKYGIGFNGDACVVGTVTGNVAICSDVRSSIPSWSSPSTQLVDVNISGVIWNSTMNRWWLFGSSSVSATVYTFDGINTPTPLVIKDEFGNIIDLFTDSVGNDAWCMCGIQIGTSSSWVIGGKGLDQVSSLAILTPSNPSATEWSVLYETTITTGKNYLRCLATDGTNILGGHTGRAIIRSPILGLTINSWTNYSTVYASWIDLTYSGDYWFAGVGSPFNLGRCVLWSEDGIRWDQLYVGPGITTAYTIRASPGLISGVSSVLATSFSPKRLGILTANPYTTLDVRGNIASYTQYMNVGTSDNGLNLIKNNVATPAIGTLTSAGVFSLDIPDPNVSVIEILGSFRLTAPDGGTYGVLNVNSLGQLIFNSYTPGGTGITGPIVIAGPETLNV